jgi:IS30 family transposase
MCSDAQNADHPEADLPHGSTSVNPRVSSANTGAGDRAIALKLKYPDLSAGQIAKAVGCNPSNVHRVLERFKTRLDDLQDYKEYKGDIWDSVAMRAVKSIDDAKLQTATAVQLATVAGIAFDKSQLVHGLATQVNVSVLLDLVQAARDMRDKQP